MKKIIITMFLSLGFFVVIFSSISFDVNSQTMSHIIYKDELLGDQTFSSILFNLQNSLPKVPDKMMIYITKTPEITIETVNNLMKNLDLHGQITPWEKGLYVANEEKVLMIYTNPGTGYIRYRDNPKLLNEKAVEHLPSEEKARELAEKFLDETGLSSENMHFSRIGDHGYRYYDNDGILLDEGEIAIHVKFYYTINGTRVLGPGAKAGVIFGENSEIIGAYKIWRDLEEVNEKEIISADAAFELFKNRWDIDKKEDWSNSTSSINVIIEQVLLTYFMNPGFDPQEYIEPVYIFTGGIQSIYSSENQQNNDCSSCGEPFQIIIPAISE